MKQAYNDNWLAPDDKFSFDNLDSNGSERNGVNDKDSKHDFEFRLRFKLPLASKLLEVDKAAFNYYYCQVKTDYLKNVVCSSEAKAANGKKNC